MDNNCTGRGRGFSLVELLVVIALMAIIMGLSIPAYSSLMRAGRLTASLQTVMGDLDLARQAAISRNQVVEVRLYYLPDYNSNTTVTAGNGFYRGIQCFLENSTPNGSGASNSTITYTQISKPDFFTQPVLISQKYPANTNVNVYGACLVDPAQVTAGYTCFNTSQSFPVGPSTTMNYQSTANAIISMGSYQLPTYGTNYMAAIFHFTSLGATDLASVTTGGLPIQWYLTLVLENDGLNAPGSLANYYPKNYATITLDPVTGALGYFRP